MTDQNQPQEESRLDKGLDAGEGAAEGASSACFVVDLFDDVCYVATAAHGDLQAEEVVVLRRYRDVRLMTNRHGRAAVSVYYTVGPVAATIINRFPVLKPPARRALAPMVWWARRTLKR